MALVGPGADLGIALAVFAGTNLDNTVVTSTLVADAPAERAHRIAAGQVLGFAVLVAVAGAAAAVLFQFSPAVVGLLGLVPLALGMKGIWARVRAGRRGDGRDDWVARRAVGRSLTAAALVTIAAGGDNLAAYIPLFRVGGVTNLVGIVAVFTLGEVVVTTTVLGGRRHPGARHLMTRLGAPAVPVLLCGVGVLVMLESGTLSWL